MDDSDARQILGYRTQLPERVWVQIGPAVTTLVTAVAGRVPYGTGDLMSATAKIAAWALEHGLPNDPAFWMRHDVIDQFVLTAGLKGQGPQSYRSLLTRMSEVLALVERGERPRPVLSVPSTVSAPYDAADMARIEHAADSLSDRHRANAWAVIALARGCGMAPGEISRARGTWFHVTETGACVFDDPDDADRFVVCRPDYEAHLAALLHMRGNRLLFRPERTNLEAKNTLSAWAATVRLPPPIGRLEARRLRSTWIVEMLTLRIDREILAKAAGLSGSAQLSKYTAWVPKPTRAEVIGALRSQRG